MRKGIAMKFRVVIAAAAIALTVGACENSSLGGTKQTVGTLGGAALGGLFGAQFGGGSGHEPVQPGVVWFPSARLPVMIVRLTLWSRCNVCLPTPSAPTAG